MELLNRILSNIPVLKQLNGNKSAIGILSLVVYCVGLWAPQHLEMIMQILGWLGITLTPIGLIHKAIK